MLVCQLRGLTYMYSNLSKDLDPLLHECQYFRYHWLHARPKLPQSFILGCYEDIYMKQYITWYHYFELVNVLWNLIVSVFVLTRQLTSVMTNISQNDSWRQVQNIQTMVSQWTTNIFYIPVTQEVCTLYIEYLYFLSVNIFSSFSWRKKRLLILNTKIYNSTYLIIVTNWDIDNSCGTRNFVLSRIGNCCSLWYLSTITWNKQELNYFMWQSMAENFLHFNEETAENSIHWTYIRSSL